MILIVKFIKKYNVNREMLNRFYENLQWKENFFGVALVFNFLNPNRAEIFSHLIHAGGGHI